VTREDKERLARLADRVVLRLPPKEEEEGEKQLCLFVAKEEEDQVTA